MAARVLGNVVDSTALIQRDCDIAEHTRRGAKRGATGHRLERALIQGAFSEA